MDLSNEDLIIDKIYGGSRIGNSADDPLPSLLGVDNGAGFRHLGKRPSTDTLKLLVLKSNFNDPDWPDQFDPETGILTYYGDNKKVGEIHDTPRQGNLILRNLFDRAHDRREKKLFPAILVFGGTGTYRDVRFLGLAVPGAAGFGPDDDLVAIWRARGIEKNRFQNYKSIFTILDVPVVRRKWITDIASGMGVTSKHAPREWISWLRHGKYSPLTAPHSIEIRDRKSQLPSTKAESIILQAIYNRFSPNPFKFEECAMRIAQLMMPAIKNIENTRPWRDGGRDAIGTYKIGTGGGSIDVEFALEAKCYNSNAGVGVKELSRLLARLKHRQFGILVTTSYLSSQAYKELKEDEHPVVVISGLDLAKILKERVGDIAQINSWLDGL
jgi:transposase-like protein